MRPNPSKVTWINAFHYLRKEILKCHPMASQVAEFKFPFKTIHIAHWALILHALLCRLAQKLLGIHLVGEGSPAFP